MIASIHELKKRNDYIETEAEHPQHPNCNSANASRVRER
jgi:hypothetical protein